MRVRISWVMIVLVASCIIFSGCADNTHMSKQDMANFNKGGPMPPGAAAAMAQRRANFIKSEPSAFKSWQANREAELAKRGGSSTVPIQANTK